MASRSCADARDIEEETFDCNCLNPSEFVLGLLERATPRELTVLRRHRKERPHRHKERSVEGQVG